MLVRANLPKLRDLKALEERGIMLDLLFKLLDGTEFLCAGSQVAGAVNRQVRLACAACR